MSRNPDRDYRDGFVPALGFGVLTSLYDPVVAMLTRESRFKARLLEQASVTPGSDVLDLGCGTGTLAIQLASRVPGCSVTGIDADVAMLARARRKAVASAAPVQFDHGYAQNLPYPDGRFDAVVSSLFFHHLSSEHKREAASEAFRVLKPGGGFHVADWGKATSPAMRLLFYSVQLLDGFATTRDNANGLLPEIFASAGFAGATTGDDIPTACGTLSLFSASKPGSVKETVPSGGA